MVMTELRYIDSDGHILEHPTAMPAYAPKEFRDRIWHVETDDKGQEWVVYGEQRTPANQTALAGTAGFTIIANGSSATREIGAKALLGSYGNLGYKDGLIAWVPILPMRIV